MSKQSIPPELLKTLLEDKDGNGIPDAFEGSEVKRTYEVNGTVYHSLDDMPPEHRKLFDSIPSDFPLDVDFELEGDGSIANSHSSATVTRTTQSWSTDSSVDIDAAPVELETTQRSNQKTQPSIDTRASNRSNSVQRQSSNSGLLIILLALACIGLAVAYMLK